MNLKNKLKIIGITTLAISALGIVDYYLTKEMHKRGGRVITHNLETGNIQIQPWLYVWDTDGDGEADKTNVLSRAGVAGAITIAYSRESTQKEKNWYREQIREEQEQLGK